MIRVIFMVGPRHAATTILALNATVLLATNLAGVALAVVLIFAAGWLRSDTDRGGWFLAASIAVVTLHAAILIRLSRACAGGIRMPVRNLRVRRIVTAGVRTGTPRVRLRGRQQFRSSV